MKRKHLWVGIAILVVIIVAGSAYWWYRTTQSQPDTQKTPTQQITQIETNAMLDEQLVRANEYPVGSDTWLELMLNLSITAAQNDACSKAREYYDTARKQVAQGHQASFDATKGVLDEKCRQ